MATYIYIPDSGNNRLKRHDTSDLSYVDEVDLGSYWSWGMCATKDYVYNTHGSNDTNDKIQKRNAADLSLVTSFGTQGTGDDQFNNPSGICTDGSYLYIADADNHRIKKHNCSDLTYVLKLGSQGSGDNNFNTPHGIDTDGTYLYIADTTNDRIKIHACSDLSYIDDFGTEGSGNDNFQVPRDVCVDDNYIYIADAGNDRIKKHNKTSPYAYVSATSGTSPNTINAPEGIASDSAYLYIASGDEIQKRKKSDLSFVSKLGSTGSGNDNFYYPKRLNVGRWLSEDNLSVSLTVSNKLLENAAVIKENLAVPLYLSTELDGEATYYTKVHAGIEVGHRMNVKTNKLKPDYYAYYLGDEDGKVYTYSGDYNGDNGDAITATYVSKVLDFADQLPQYNDKFKTVDAVKVYYVDLSADTTITVYLSNDAGNTFSSDSEVVGTGDGKIKSKLFHFIKTGQYFQLKISESSANKQFCVLGAELVVYPHGEWMDI